MKTRDTDFVFPVLGFTPDKEIWAFEDMETLTSCGPRTLKNNIQIGMELVDSDGRRWIVRSVTRLGRAYSLSRSMLTLFLSAIIQSRIEEEIEPLEPLSLTEVKARVCAALEAFPEDFGQYLETDNELAPFLAQVRADPNIASIPKMLGLDNCESY